MKITMIPYNLHGTLHLSMLFLVLLLQYAVAHNALRWHQYRKDTYPWQDIDLNHYGLWDYYKNYIQGTPILSNIGRESMSRVTHEEFPNLWPSLYFLFFSQSLLLFLMYCFLHFCCNMSASTFCLLVTEEQNSGFAWQTK